MNRLLTGIVCAAALACTEAAFASVLSENYDFSSNSVSFSKETLDGTEYDVVEMEGFPLDGGCVGAPQLPFLNVRFAIPWNERLDSVTAGVVAETLPGCYFVKPTQLPGCPICDSQPLVYPISQLYTQQWPSRWIDGVAECFAADFRLASLNLRPFMSLPNGQIVQAEQCTVHIFTSATSDFGGIKAVRRSDFCREQLSNYVAGLVENPGDLPSMRRGVQLSPPGCPLVLTDGPSLDGSTVDCVIICCDDDKLAYERYADFLTEQGIVTVVRGRDWINSNPAYTGRDKAESMRNFVKAADSLWGTAFVILAGWQTDRTQIGQVGLPTRMVPNAMAEPFGHAGSELHGLATTDQYFADLEGTWDENHNNVFGESCSWWGTSSMFFVDRLHGWASRGQASGDTIHMFWSSDGGRTWTEAAETPAYPGAREALANDVFFTTSDSGWCAGYTWPAGGVRPSLARTGDGGHHWSCLTSLPDCHGMLQSVNFKGPDSGWISAVGCLGDSSFVARTVDGGASWTNFYRLRSTSYPRCIRFDPTGATARGWVCVCNEHTRDALILLTTDGGASWTPETIQPWQLVNSISFTDAEDGWAVGGIGHGRVWHTTDGGYTWDSFPSPAESFIADVSAVPGPAGTALWVCGVSGTLYRRDWAGGQWTSIVERPGLNHVQFVDSLTGWFSGANHHLLTTTNGGSTWSETPMPFFQGDSSVDECMPDVLVGRLPSLSNHAGEPDLLIDKLTQYQTNPDVTALKKVQFYAAMENKDCHFIGYHERIQDQSWYNNSGLETYELYDPLSGESKEKPVWPSWQGDDWFRKQNVIDAMNSGFQFASHAFHAGYNALECPPQVGSENYIAPSLFISDSVSNAGKAGIIASCGCHAAYLVDSLAIGRNLLVAPHGGAIAYFGSSIEGWFSEVVPGPFFLEAIYDHGQTRLGSAFANTITIARGTGYSRTEHNLLGDPLMDIVTEIPKDFVVSGLPSYLEPEPTVINVHVTESGAGNVSDATVCLSMRHPDTETCSVYEIGQTNGNGVAHFDIDPTETGELLVTVTKHNYHPHKDTVHVGLFSNDAQATANNEQRHLARVAGTDELLMVYADGGRVMYSHSDNSGQSWQRPQVIDTGSCPSITLNYATISNSTRDQPWVVYKQGPSIKAAFPGQTWLYRTLFSGSSPDSVAEPAAVAANPTPVDSPSAWAAYEVRYANPFINPYYRIEARRFTRMTVQSAYVLDQQVSPWETARPSIAITPHDTDIVHVIWQRTNNTTGKTIYYREFRTSWTTAWPISANLPNPHNSFVEAYGDTVIASLSTATDVYECGRRIDRPYFDWKPSPPGNVSNTPGDPSDWPVVATDVVVAWQEVAAGSGEIYTRVGAEIHNFSNTTANSAYPNIDVELHWLANSATVNCIWTEYVQQGLYEVKFKSADISLWPTFAAGRGYPKYLSVQTGESLASSYCQYRTGFFKVGRYSLDYGKDSLRYILPYLDRQYDYYVRAIVYHEGPGKWRQAIRLNDSLARVLDFDDGKPETLWVKIPEQAYRWDAASTLRGLRLRGSFSVITDFAVYQLEPERPKGQGKFSGLSPLNVPLQARFSAPAPNPFSHTVQMAFSLNRPAKVGLKVFDASGRLIKVLVEGDQQAAGCHTVFWRGDDARGAKAATGIYFARLAVETETKVHKVVLTR